MFITYKETHFRSPFFDVRVELNSYFLLEGLCLRVSWKVVEKIGKLLKIGKKQTRNKKQDKKTNGWLGQYRPKSV